MPFMEAGVLRGSALADLNASCRRGLERSLAGFRPWTGEECSGEPVHGVEVEWGRPFEPWELRFLLVDVVGCEDLGRFEKVAWVATTAVDDIPVEFSHRKFGLRAAVGCGTAEAAKELVATVLRRLESAMPLVSKHLIRPRVEAAIGRGDVSMTNLFPYFESMYEHLRGLSERSAADASTLQPIRTEHAVAYPAAQRAQEAEFEAHGALFAFFSLVEHVMLIEVTFSDADVADLDLARYLRAGWSDKFKRVVDLADGTAKNAYDTLKTLADENRNPAAHGGVDRGATNLSVHLRGYGAVPIGVHADSPRPRFTFRPMVPKSVFPFAEALGMTGGTPGWDALDRTMAWIEEGQLASACQYGRSGLPLVFDRDNRVEAHRARGDREAVEVMIDHRGWLVEHAANMDW